MAFKPSNEEQKWAKQLEIDLKKEIFEKLPGGEKESSKSCFWRKCPNDGSDLLEETLDSKEIKIQKCSECGGIWIDQCTLEKILQLSKYSEHFLEFLRKILKIRVNHH